MDKQVNSKSVFGFIWSFAKQDKAMLIVIQICALAFAIDNSVWPYVTGYLIDTISEYNGPRIDIWSNLGNLFIIAAILELYIVITYRVAGILSSFFFPKFEARIRMFMFEYVQKHSQKYFMDNFSGKIANKINDLPNSAYLMVDQILNLYVPTIFAAAFSTVIFFQLSPYFASLLLGWVVIHLLISVITARKCHFKSYIHSESRSTLQGRILDNIINANVVRAFSRKKYELDFVKKYQKEEKALYYDAMIYAEMVRIVQGIIHVGFFFYTGYLVIEQFRFDLITVGELVVILSSFINISFMVWYSGIELPFFIRQMGICSQALSIIRDSHEIKNKPHAEDLVVKKGKIEFKNVTFHYEEDKSLFQNKNLSILPGQTIGLVGYSGSGKTTIINLLLRYYELDSGKILIDGQNIQDVTQDSLRNNISMIPQDSSLFHRTIMENIRYGRLDATDEEVYEAAKRAYCDDFIEELPGKYDFIVGERGLKLSGGQRQRIAIARAILKDAQILILDEATAALDSITEEKIQNALNYVMKGKTSIIIAHRLSTLTGVDKIIVFEKGKIVEQGSHAELVKLKGHYHKMWQRQMGGFLPED